MPNVILLESEDFLMASLNAIMQNSSEQAGNTDSEVDLQITAEKGMDWDSVYKEKVKGKSAKHMEAFLKLYFETELEDPAVVEALLAIDAPLVLEFERRGFSTKVNPYIHFFRQKFVIEKLLKNKKLNKGVFSAISEAVLNKKIAMRELIKTNNYNIIYCLDFYTKNEADAYKYLEQQNLILKCSKNPSNTDKQQNIERLFGDADADIETAKLLDLSNLKKIDTENSLEDDSDEDESTATAKSTPIDTFINKAADAIKRGKLSKRDVLQYLGIVSKKEDLIKQAADMPILRTNNLEGMKILAKYLGKKLITEKEIEKIKQELELTAQ